MGAEEPGGGSTAGPVVVGEALPEVDGLAGVVAGLGHVDEADMVGFEFLFPAVGEGDTKGGAEAIGGHDEGANGGILLAGGDGDGASSDLEHDGLTHTFRAVAGDRVGDFVADHGGESGFIQGDGKDAGMDANLSAGEAKGIGFIVVENDELPLGAGEVGDGSDSFTDLPDHGVDFGIVVDGAGLFDFLKGGLAEAHFLTFGEEDHLAPAGFGYGCASGAEEGGAGDEQENEAGCRIKNRM